MAASVRRPVVAVLALCFLVFALPGCAWWNRVHTTQISVQVSGEHLLHLAIVPRTLPNGERPTDQLAALLADVAERAGGYTYIERVMGGWIPPEKGVLEQEISDLLLVAGDPGLAYFLRERLREDFEQRQPFVISLPIQSIAVVTAVPETEEEGKGEAAAETPEPAAAAK